MTYLFQLELDR